MSKNEKLINKIESKPYKNDISFEEIDRYLKLNGFNLNSINGSHHNYMFGDVPSLDFLVTIPSHGNSVKAIYIKKAVEMVKKVKEEE